MPRSGLVQRAGAANPHAFGTFVMPPACAGDHAKSKWGYLTGDVREKYNIIYYDTQNHSFNPIPFYRHNNKSIRAGCLY
jgi:hypothetical protein